MKWIILLSLSVTMAVLYGCVKEINSPDEHHGVTSSSEDAQLGLATAVLAYSDTIFYLKNQPGNYIIKPASKPTTSGYFKAIPLGLIYDSSSGWINITKSESGLRYKMYYLSISGQKIDSAQFVISGIDYSDGIYNLGAGQDAAFPIYEASSGSFLPCGDDDDDNNNDDDDDGCIFDERDLDDDGTNDIRGANGKGFRVNRRNAVINLYATIAAGALGTNPQNGATGDFRFFYRLDDISNRALQDITVRLYYYETVADIPTALVNELNKRKAQDDLVNSFHSGLTPLLSQGVRAEKVTARPKRPPLIIIVGYTPQ